MLFGIEASFGGTSTRWLDRLLFFVVSDLTIGSATVFTYAFALILVGVGYLVVAGPLAGRGVAAAAPAAGFAGAAFGVADLKTFFPLEAPEVSSLE